MLIESIAKRKDGTRVTLDSTEYHFKPSAADPRHLAEVLIKAHAERFLSISEGYRFAGEGELPQEPAAAPVTAPSRMPRTSITHNASYEVGERSITLQELTVLALRESGLSVDEWNAQEDEELYDQLDTTLDELRSEAELAASNQAPVRGEVIQPQPEEGLEEPEEDEAMRQAIEAELRAQAGGDGQPEEQEQQEEPKGDDQADDTNTGAADTSNVAGEQPKQAIPSHDELVAAYKTKMGRAPSSKLSDERIHQLLQEDDE